MPSSVEICNLALAHLRVGSINSLEEASTQAQYCKIFYSTARDQILKDYNWGFSRKVAPLQRLSDVTVFEWQAAWRYPVDCLRINRLVRNLEQQYNETYTYPILNSEMHLTPRSLPDVEYAVFTVNGGTVIVTNESELRIDYRSRVEDTLLYPPDLVIAFSYLLASYLSVPLVGVKDGRALRTDNLALYTEFLASERADSSSENHRENPESEFITVRGM